MIVPRSSHRSVCFLDTETTGLDEGPHEIIEFAASIEGWVTPGDILPRHGSRWQKREISFKIKPEHIETAHPRALEVNGYTEEAWADALTMKEALEQITLFVHTFVHDTWPVKSMTLEEYSPGGHGPLVAGQNVGFDIRFLKKAFKDAGMEYPFHYHNLDTQVLSYEHLKPLGQRSISLGAVCTTLGISNDGAHTALADVRRSRAVWQKLSRAGWVSRLRWRFRIWRLNRNRR